MTRLLIAATVIGLTVAAASPAQAEPSTVITSDGTCTSLKVKGDDGECSGLMFMLFPATNRGSFIFGGPTTISFSGTTMPPTASGAYVLAIDHFEYLVTSSSDRPTTVPAHGSCSLLSDVEATLVKTISCDIDSDFGRVVLKFKGQGLASHQDFPNGVIPHDAAPAASADGTAATPPPVAVSQDVVPRLPAPQNYLSAVKRPVYDTLWQIALIVKSDVLVINKIVVNRNNCHIVNTSGPVGTPMKFGTQFVLTTVCDPIEVNVQTDQGDQVFTWDN